MMKTEASKNINHNGFNTTPTIFQVIPVLVILFLIVEIICMMSQC
jgi:hypothetical protein